MSEPHDLNRILVDILGLDAARTRLDDTTALLGQLPEFDSMAVVSVLTAIEDHYGIVVDDDEIDAAVFETVGTLRAFVDRKIA
jgi:acyl carrier protein